MKKVIRENILTAYSLHDMNIISVDIVGNDIISVSYTHLDVYKRQRASWEFHCFSMASAAFHKVLRSAYSGGAWGGSMISVWTISLLWE